MDICSIPFNSHLGLEPAGEDARICLSLTPKAIHLNHIGTVHAGVIFSIGEAAAGQALLHEFADLAESAVPVLRNATTKYRKPAGPHARLTSTASITGETARIFRQTLTDRGRALIEIDCRVDQDDQTILRGTYTFFVAKNT